MTMMGQHISAQPTQSPGDEDSQALEQAVQSPSLEIFKAWLDKKSWSNLTADIT